MSEEKCPICSLPLGEDASILSHLVKGYDSEETYHTACIYPKQVLINPLPLGDGRHEWFFPLSLPTVPQVLAFLAKQLEGRQALQGKVIPRYYRIGMSGCVTVRHIVYYRIHLGTGTASWKQEEVDFHITMLNKFCPQKRLTCSTQALWVALQAHEQGIRGNRHATPQDVECSLPAPAEAVDSDQEHVQIIEVIK